MKFLNKIWGIGLLALMLVMAAPNKSLAQNDYISDQDFYDSLSPYGIWVYDPQYGDVWVPDVQGDFRPYATDGHWVLTEYGNTWVSDYPWGWATFHYGRWRFDDYYGWEWIPGYDWAPAWVSWRQGGGYYGWAPLLPGIDISLSIGGGYNIPNDYWVFAPQAYITSPNIYNYYVPRTRVVNIIRNATIINNVYTHDNHRYIAGPRVQDIQRVTHRNPEIYRINNSNSPGPVNISNKTVNIYRPAVRRAPDARPERVVDANAYKQQNPNQGIARRGSGGAGYNRANASKLAEVARSSNPNNNVVHVNNRPNNNQPGNRNDQNRPGQNPQPGNVPNNNQPGNRGFRGRPEDRPNIAPQNNAQPATPAQPGTPSDNGRRRDQNGAQFNRQQQNDAAQQQAQQQQQQDARRQQMQQQQDARRQQMQQQQDAQRQQQQDAHRQQMQQQQDAQRQQQQDVRRQQMQQQQDAQRQQQQDARRQQMQQQQDAQRQQQQDARRQQMQQQQDAQRQQMQQQQDAQRQQMQQQRQQQQDAQRQQQMQQQRQQQDAQRQQQQQQEQQQRQARPAREAQPQ